MTRVNKWRDIMQPLINIIRIEVEATVEQMMLNNFSFENNFTFILC